MMFPHIFCINDVLFVVVFLREFFNAYSRLSSVLRILWTENKQKTVAYSICSLMFERWIRGDAGEEPKQRPIITDRAPWGFLET